ncbi:hypothetical protein BBD42_03905 [Paenibacillus sp. BIHB 4019]|uniref:Uncharacterized protein n=1 Tax=Paenibacillus sp. BIHB 4019 TaxID=1870819 RepID=A0A1B2DDB1_9BACL|nr:hypothetical protein BBD42_03905 [Paenibacillus sp. BIHB 4019]
MESGEYPYNAYDTQFLKKEFVYESVLNFRFINNEYNNKTYEFVLLLVFNLMKKNHSNALFLSNGDNELCFFTKERIYLEDNNFWLNYISLGIFDGREYCNFNGNYIY